MIDLDRVPLRSPAIPASPAPVSQRGLIYKVIERHLRRALSRSRSAAAIRASSKTPAQEALARELSAQLRCLVCQNESIDESGADLARDLRVLIREKISKGDSNDEIRSFLVASYGEFILLQPPFNMSTLLLWLSMPLLLLAGGLVVYRASLRPRLATAALTEEEERGLARFAADTSKDPLSSDVAH